MAETRTIARPYAEAVFKLAKTSGTLPAWSEMLQLLAAIATDERIQALVGNPKVPPKRLGELLLGICDDQLTDEGRNFVLLLAENSRVEVLPEVSEMFEQLKTRHDGVLDAKVTSAFAMSDAQLKDLVADLEARFKRKIEAKVSIDPELIGGVKVEVGDEVLDASVRAKLEAMAVALKS
ncbi:ATP synthase F1 subcomplex delta subunit [Nitrosospira sp. Nsp18]|uniref:F0F1 ATP synthase subunit delta n=1 Tax=Nitrosospira sp. Nsp18 TaxID=1855334 RepID=UPI00088D4381|nr:F0F1 ATP synthase subunit delta [Nitrosospira sp. Nsp18]SDA27819.1 ATP synthase F1 subcomplex delta subunit [Nitrosospira sp. Nsp18]